MANHVLLTEDSLDVGSVSTLVGSASAGGTSMFIGTTRNLFEGKRVVSLEYHAYEAMAVREMHKLCTLARSKWSDIVSIVIHHRLGAVSVGEASVIIAVSAPHRLDAIGTTPNFAYDLYPQVLPAMLIYLFSLLNLIFCWYNSSNILLMPCRGHPNSALSPVLVSWSFAHCM